jgi:DNA-binding NarL/FixJ family response regulator
MMQSYRVIVVDSHRMFNEGLCELLKKKIKTFNLIDSCYSIEAAKQKMLQQQYDFLFTDIAMTDGDPKEFIAYCRQKYSNLTIIAVSSITNCYEIKELLGIGINAYLSKSAGSDELQTAIERTWAGEKYISVELAGRLATAIYVKDNSNLTKKELEVLRLVAKGLTINQAAELMHLSQHTIIGHRRNIMQKLGIRSATGIVKYAYENKLF